MSGTWEAFLGLPFTTYCGPGPGGPNGCGDNSPARVSQDTAEATYFSASSTPSLVVLRPGAGDGRRRPGGAAPLTPDHLV